MYNVLNFNLDDLYLSHPNGISLASGMPNTTTFPVEDISLTYKHNNLIKFNKPELSAALQYGPSQGWIILNINTCICITAL